jgi:hypothetical protein
LAKESQKVTINAPLIAGIFQHAEKYRLLALLPWLTAPNPDEKAKISTILSFQTQTLEAFACELYLKCLLMIDGTGAPKGHDLFRLHEALSAKTKAHFRYWYDQEPYAQDRQKRFRAFAEAVNKAEPGDIKNIEVFVKERSDLCYQIKASRNSFQMMRYVYESVDNIDHLFIAHDVMEAARVCAVDLHHPLREIMMGPGR